MEQPLRGAGLSAGHRHPPGCPASPRPFKIVAVEGDACALKWIPQLPKDTQRVGIAGAVEQDGNQMGRQRPKGKGL